MGSHGQAGNIDDVTGFSGNSDLYGIGIRIGYYTAALSIWISNLWAPTEIYFLRPITMTFLVALLIGVSFDSRDPSTTYAIEPFMLMQVAYDTYSMGLYGPPSPELLVWEKEYFTWFFTCLIGLCLHGYDTWYWWVGKDLMMKTPGGSGTTLGLFLQFGQQDLFSWIKYPMRTFLAVALVSLSGSMVINILYRALQKRMDELIKPQRLEELAGRWMRDMGMLITKEEGGFLVVPAVPGGGVSRQASKLSTVSRKSVHGSPSKAGASASGKAKDMDGDDPVSPDGSDDSGDTDDMKSQDNRSHPNHQRNSSSVSSPPKNSPPTFIPIINRAATADSDTQEPITRTLSDRIRYTVLGWKPDPNASHLPVSKLPSYYPAPDPSYTPSLETLIPAMELLDRGGRIWRKMPNIHNWAIPFLPFIAMRYCWLWFYDITKSTPLLIYHLCKNGVRPRFLLAYCVYGSTLAWNRPVCWPHFLLRAVKHPTYKLQSVTAYDVALATRIRSSLHPPPKTNRTTILLLAYLNFSLCGVLVAGTELAIQWNKIDGVQNITSVGQLIPAAIGIGGLVKVLWTALFEKDAEIDLCFGRCRGILRRARWKEASEWYEKAADEWLRRRELESLQGKEEDEKREKALQRFKAVAGEKMEDLKERERVRWWRFWGRVKRREKEKS